MTTDAHVQDKIYAMIGEELSRKEYHPGPLARAVAEANGDRNKLESLYIRFRFEELYREAELAYQVEAMASGALTCPYCHHTAMPERVARGNALLLIFLFCLYIVPGLLYAIAFSGYKAICSNCGKTLVDHID